MAQSHATSCAAPVLFLLAVVGAACSDGDHAVKTKNGSAGASSGAVNASGGVANASGGTANISGGVANASAGTASTSVVAVSGGSVNTSSASAVNGGDRGIGGRSSAATAGGAALLNPAPGTKAFVGVNFWRIDWEGTADFFLSNVQWQTVQNPWQPQLLTDLAPFTVLRFMDWNLTNDDPNPQSNWASRKLPTQSQTSEPIAFEWQLDLCNRALKDCWITVPIQANASFQASLAQLTYERLDARLRLYVEYSNEVWNGGFPQADLALAQADQLNLPTPGNSCCTTETIKLSNSYVYGAVRLFEQFESVFGKNSPRLVKVLSGQAGWDGPCQVHMQALKNTTLNPKGTMPSVYAIAPYFGGTSLSTLTNGIPTASDGVKAHVSCAAKQGLTVIGYEGGSDSYAAGNGCATLQHDAGMYEIYKKYLDALVAAGMKGPIMQYTAVGSCWGLKEKTGDSLEKSPKYRAVAEWIAAQP
ncbi:MAG TPA: hypothetical protein VIV60_03095 [Polyangiaceae bacterium]